MSIHRSHLASPGGSTAFSNTAVRRSPLPNWPSRSTHMAAGSTTSAYWVDSVGYTSLTQTNASNTPFLSPLAQKAGQVGQRDWPSCYGRDHRKSMLPFDSSRKILTVWKPGVLDVVQVAFGQIPDGLGVAAVLRVGHQQVGGQTVAERAHLARGAAGGRLAGERERAVARLGDLARQQVDVVDVVVHPRAAVVLVHAHGPQAHDARVGLGEHGGQLAQVLHGHAGKLRGVFEACRARGARRIPRT